MLPSGGASRPLASKSNEPARVYVCWLPVFVTKKPSPLIMKSLSRPVAWVEPWLKLVAIAATFTPRPTWAGFVPAVLAVGAEPLRRTCDSVSSKTVVLLLKPTVLTLAMLLPTTSILVWWAWRPEIAEKSERSMARSSLVERGQDAEVAVDGGMT